MPRKKRKVSELVIPYKHGLRRYRVSKFALCMGDGLRGKKFRGRAEARKAFKKLVKVCKAKA